MPTESSRASGPSPAGSPANAVATAKAAAVWPDGNENRSRFEASAWKSVTARTARPISRWISTVRPFCFPTDASRWVR